MSGERLNHYGGVPGAAGVMALMGLVLALALSTLGLLEASDGVVRRWFDDLAAGKALGTVPMGVVWVFLGLAWFGLTWAMIDSPGWWRPLVLWVSGGMVIAAATPVAALAGGWIGPTAPMAGWLWSGLWALIYRHRHAHELEAARRKQD